MADTREEKNAGKDTQQNEGATEKKDDATNNNDSASQNTQPESVEYVTMDAFNQLNSSIVSLKQTMDTIMGGIKSIKDAQGVMVRAGMIVHDDSDPEPIDDFKPLSELDFSVKR